MHIGVQKSLLRLEDFLLVHKNNKLLEKRHAFLYLFLHLFSVALYKLDLLPVIISIQYSLPHSNEISSYCAHFANEKDAAAQVVFLDCSM